MKPTEFFQEEIGWVKNAQMKKFLLDSIDYFPPYFMLNPASSTGKYHASWSNTTGSAAVAGGLANHVKVMCFWVHALADAYMLTADEHDACIVATLYHDAIKYGFGGGKYTTKTHEMEGATFFQRCTQKFCQSMPLAEEIYTAIAFHQGRWAVADPPKNFPEDFSKIGQLVHIADMCASRKGVTYDCLKEEGSMIG